MDGISTFGTGRRRRWAVVMVALGLAVVSACSNSSDSGSSDAGSSQRTSPSAAPPPDCAQPSDQVKDLELDRGATGTTLRMGSGPRGVVLAPQSDGDVCQWVPFGRRLVGMGYHVITFGPWSQPYAPQVDQAAAELRQSGATRIVLIGASQGGTMVLGRAAHQRPQAAGVISLSGETKADDGTDAIAEIKRYSGPLLLLGSENDIYVMSTGTRAIAAAHPGSETVVIFPGYAHGVEFLTGPESSRTITEMDTFLRKALPA